MSNNYSILQVVRVMMSIVLSITLTFLYMHNFTDS